MATYEYRCPEEGCGYTQEFRVPMGTAIDAECPRCFEFGKTNKLVKVLTAPNVNTGSKTTESNRDFRTVVRDLSCGMRHVSYRGKGGEATGIVRPDGRGVFDIETGKESIPEIIEAVRTANRDIKVCL